MLPYIQRLSYRTPSHRYHHRLPHAFTQCMILKTFVISMKTLKIKIINVSRYINLFLWLSVYRFTVYTDIAFAIFETCYNRWFFFCIDFKTGFSSNFSSEYSWFSTFPRSFISGSVNLHDSLYHNPGRSQSLNSAYFLF